eukprot:Skav236584  [mRNA]  locus=scaffold529:94454:94937:- [translate_table: standard]
MFEVRFFEVCKKVIARCQFCHVFRMSFVIINSKRSDLLHQISSSQSRSVRERFVQGFHFLQSFSHKFQREVSHVHKVSTTFEDTHVGRQQWRKHVLKV